MANLMNGKRGLVMGVANERSIAWGIAKALRAEGAELAFSFQGDNFGKRVRPLAEQLDVNLLLDVDVTDDDSLDACFSKIEEEWGRLDFVVHAIAYSDKTELAGRFINTTRENFKNSLTISCYSLIDVARRAEPLMSEGGTILTLTYMGSNRVTPFYNVMGVAKAALESSVRYLANDMGPNGIRVNAISPGPMKTLAGAAISGARRTFNTARDNAPLRANATLEAIGGTAVYLASDMGACTTGEICTSGMCGGGTAVTNCSQTGDGCCPMNCTALDDIDCACSSDSLVAPYNRGNGLDGAMFDVVAKSNAIEVQGFDVSIASVTTTIEIYYRPGTHVGFEESSAGWTLAGSAMVTGAGLNMPTPVPVTLSINIPAGQTYGFYVTTTTSGMDYTNGTALGNVLVENADLQILEGTGKNYPFGTSTITPREFNGTIYYEACGS